MSSNFLYVDIFKDKCPFLARCLKVPKGMVPKVPKVPKVPNTQNALNQHTREAQFVLQFLVRVHLRQKMPIPRAVPKGA